MQLGFTPKGWEHYQYWLQTDRKILNRVNELIKDCLRNPFTGVGKPEKLKGALSGLYSRRINEEHRLVYAVTDSWIVIVQCRFHYSQ